MKNSQKLTSLLGTYKGVSETQLKQIEVLNNEEEYSEKGFMAFSKFIYESLIPAIGKIRDNVGAFLADQKTSFSSYINVFS